MPMSLPLPDWVPWWGQLVILVVAILFALAFLMMPFAVFGLKGRLDFLEAQLDDIHAEIRMLAMRLPEADRRVVRPSDAEAASPRRGGGDWSDGPTERFEDEPAPRRPLRAVPVRSPERNGERTQDRGRAEPTLRRPQTW